MDDKLTIDDGPSNVPTEISYSRSVPSGTSAAPQVNVSTSHLPFYDLQIT